MDGIFPFSGEIKQVRKCVNNVNLNRNYVISFRNVGLLLSYSFNAEIIENKPVT